MGFARSVDLRGWEVCGVVRATAGARSGVRRVAFRWQIVTRAYCVIALLMCSRGRQLVSPSLDALQVGRIRKRAAWRGHARGGLSSPGWCCRTLRRWIRVAAAGRVVERGTAPRVERLVGSSAHRNSRRVLASVSWQGGAGSQR